MPALLEQQFLLETNGLINERLKLIPQKEVGIFAENLLTLACRHLCISQNAKRIRPLLCLYYHWMLVLDVDPRFASLGVAAEFIHTASLLHDDIIDEADRRRGKPSVNHAFGNATAVLAGDFLLTEAFDLLRPFERAISEQAILVIREMTKASILELDMRGKTDVTIEGWRTIAQGKTGALFSWCGFAVGHFLKDSEAADRLWRLGHHIGFIFQLADDLKDFHGDNDLKDICRDIRNLESSLPIILAINQNYQIKDKFVEAFASGFIDENQALILRDLVMRSGALTKASQLLSEELMRALDILAIFDKTLGKHRLDRLIDELTAI